MLYSELANAIITQAITDYDVAVTRVHKQEFTCEYTDVFCAKLINDVRRFFKSPQFSMLTNLDGKYLQDIMDRRLCDKLGVTKDELYL